MAEYIYCRDAFPAVLCLQLYRTEHSNVAPVIRSAIGKTIYRLPFWIGLITMTEKAAKYRYVYLFRNKCSHTPNNVQNSVLGKAVILFTT